MGKEEGKRIGRPAKDGSGKTQRELAADEGVSLTAWKERYKEGHLAGLAGAALADEKKRAETARIETSHEREERLLQILDEQFLPKEVVGTCLRIIAGTEDQYDAAILSELPSRLSGLTPAKIEKELLAFVDEWKELRSDSHSRLFDECREAVQKEWIRGDLKKASARRK